ncbi:unnamed protein product [Ostreobium quekettii]|uniref:Tudor domain-containing protein n=1 Tax=Ostreobium quekettii TaxID=121088 RepID=A0A8S1IMT7_9CHLO|nr:unnamed protein product [Ostreobium quekettii]
MVVEVPLISAPDLGMSSGKVDDSHRKKQQGGVELVAGQEAVGRPATVRDVAAAVWEDGKITAFERDSGRHRFRSNSDGQERWLCLGRSIFRWLAPHPAGAPPNPTFKDFPGQEAAIGWKVKVYWSEMGRWYVGYVKSFDQKTGRHIVRFCDGDVRDYSLREEAVLWVEKPASGRESRKRPRKDSGLDSSGRSPTARGKRNKDLLGVGPRSGATANGAESASREEEVSSGVMDPRLAQSGGGADDAEGGAGSERAGCEGDNCPAAGDKRAPVVDSCKTSTAEVQTNDHDKQQPSQPSAATSKRSGGKTPGTSSDNTKGAENGARKLENNHEVVFRRLRQRKSPNKPSGAATSQVPANPHLNILRTRVAIWWEEDMRHYRGQVTSYREETGEYLIAYDDGESEEVLLTKERFRWIGPRGKSVGYNSSMRDIMLELGAEGLSAEPNANPSPPESVVNEGRPTTPGEMIGRRAFVFWAGDGQYHEAEVLAYDKRRKVHLVWYHDGEQEWLDMGSESVVWGDTARGCTFAAGLEAGEEPPRGRAAVGWRVGVFWKEDGRFYEGTVTNYNTGTGRHDVNYDDGEVENLSLSSEKVIWKLPAGVGGKGGKKGGKSDRRTVAAKKGAQQAGAKKASATPENTAQDDARGEQVTPPQQALAPSKAKAKSTGKGKSKTGKLAATKRMVGPKGQMAQKRQRASAQDGSGERRMDQKDPSAGTLPTRVPKHPLDRGSTPGSLAEDMAKDGNDQNLQGCNYAAEHTAKIGSGEHPAVGKLPTGSDSLDLRDRKALRCSIAAPVGNVETGERVLSDAWDPIEVSSPLKVESANQVHNFSVSGWEKNNQRKGPSANVQPVQDPLSRDGTDTGSEQFGDSRGPWTDEARDGSAPPSPGTQAAQHKAARLESMDVDENQTHQSMEDEIPTGPDLSLFKDGGLPNVDATRVVRLPEEFGSLQVRFRITAGSHGGAPSSEPKPAGRNKIPSIPYQVEDGYGNQTGNPKAQLQRRLAMAGQFLSTLEKFENAHMTLGRLPSACDLHALEVAVAQGKRRRRRNARPARGPSVSGGLVEASGPKSSDFSQVSFLRRHLSSSSSGSLKQKATPHSSAPQEQQPMSGDQEALQQERKTIGIKEPKDEHKMLSAAEPGSNRKAVGIKEPREELKSLNVKEPGNGCKVVSDKGPREEHRVLVVKEPRRSAVGGRGGTRDSGVRPVHVHDARSTLPGRLYTGAAQTSSCLVLQMPPTSGAQIGVSSVPAIAPAYYLTEYSVEDPVAGAEPDSDAVKPVSSSDTMRVTPSDAREQSKDDCEAQRATADTVVDATPLGELRTGSERCIQQRVDVVTQPMAVLQADKLCDPSTGAPDENRVSHPDKTERCADLPEAAGMQASDDLEDLMIGVSDGRDAGDKDGHSDEEPHSGVRRVLETCQSRTDVAAGND